MSRIKLPGSSKFKKIILFILIIILVGVLVKTAIENKKYEENQNKVLQEREAEDKRLAEEKGLAEKKRLAEEKKVSEETTVEVANKSEETEEEKSLYEDAFNTFHLGEYSTAIYKSDLIIEQFQNSYKAYNIRGIAKAYNGSFEEGMKDIDKSLEIKSDYGYARFNKALNYELYSDFNNALVWYDKALEVEEYLWSYYGKASIYGRRGDIQNTCIYLQKALEIAKKENIEDQVKEKAKEEVDFNPVREDEGFKELLK